MINLRLRNAPLVAIPYVSMRRANLDEHGNILGIYFNIDCERAEMIEYALIPGTLRRKRNHHIPYGVIGRIDDETKTLYVWRKWLSNIDQVDDLLPVSM